MFLFSTLRTKMNLRGSGIIRIEDKEKLVATVTVVI